MKRYTINDTIIFAKNVTDALKKYKMLDATKHEAIVYANAILSEMGKNNSIGKYDNVVRAVASLFGDGFLSGNELKERIRREIPRLLKRYNLDDSVKDARTISPWALSRGKRILSEDGDKATVISVKGDRRNGYDVVVKLDDGSRDEWYYESDDVITLTDSVKDAEPEVNVDLDFLIKDELEAIDGYRKMIAKTSNPQLLSVLSHILDEETEHVEELRAAQAGVYEVKDGIKDGHASPDTELDRAHINYDGYDEPTRGTHYFEFANKSDAEEAKKYLSANGYGPGNVKTKRDGLDTYYILQFKE